MGGPTIVSLAVALVALAVVFRVIERRSPARAPIDTRVDVAYWFFTPLVTKFVTRIALGAVFVVIAAVQGVTLADIRASLSTRETLATSLPLWLQVPLILVLADLLAYWTHRVFHRPALWKFHAVHHSSMSVDWLSSVRLHPVNDALARVVQVVPLYFLGFNATALAAVVPVLTLYALLLHANVSWSYGPLRYVIASPRFHRWHHTTEEEGLDKNFAALFPFIDLAFGTFYMPVNREPMRFGVTGNDVPHGLVAQLAYPFRRRSRG